jgi:hypothetical protein
VASSTAVGAPAAPEGAPGSTVSSVKPNAAPPALTLTGEPAPPPGGDSTAHGCAPEAAACTPGAAVATCAGSSGG